MGFPSGAPRGGGAVVLKQIGRGVLGEVGGRVEVESLGIVAETGMLVRCSLFCGSTEVRKIGCSCVGERKGRSTHHYYYY